MIQKMKNSLLKTNAPTVGNVGYFIPASNSIVQQSIDAFKAAQKPTQQIYYVDDSSIDGDDIHIDYTLNDQWRTTVISMAALKRFVQDYGLNDYCFDSCANGMHLQNAGSFEPDTFIAENLNACITAYLQSKRIGQNVN